MKILFLLLLPLSALADQSELLVKGREHFIKDAQKIIRSYCSEEDPYLCQLQMKADCSHGEEKKKAHACREISRLESLEKKIVEVDKSIKDTDDTQTIPPIVKSNPAPVLKPDIKVPEVLKQLRVIHGASVTKDGAEAYKPLKALMDKINAYKVRMDCVSAEDCALMDYGHWGCGGPNGTFVYSTRTNIPSLKSDVEEFTKLDDEYQKKWNRDLSYTCAMKNRTNPPTCIQNQCQ